MRFLGTAADMAAKAIHPANTKPTYGKAITHSIINPINKARRNKEPVIWGGGGIKLLFTELY